MKTYEENKYFQETQFGYLLAMLLLNLLVLSVAFGFIWLLFSMFTLENNSFGFFAREFPLR